MIPSRWEKLPKSMQLPEVKPYWQILRKKKFSLVLKRLFDISVSFVLLVIFCPIFIVIAIAVKLDSKGPVFYRQERITQYGRIFRIHKFRSMYVDSDKKGPLVTIDNDSRITKTGKFIRKCKLDELSQLIDVLKGDMTFVGTRPEVKKYVDKYTAEMMATLLLPAGITSTASVKYKDENSILDASSDVDTTYLTKVLPEKMKCNLNDIENFGFFREIGICFKTAFAVFKGKVEYD